MINKYLSKKGYNVQVDTVNNKLIVSGWADN